MAFVTDSKYPQPVRQPPPTAHLRVLRTKGIVPPSTKHGTKNLARWRHGPRTAIFQNSGGGGGGWGGRIQGPGPASPPRGPAYAQPLSPKRQMPASIPTLTAPNRFGNLFQPPSRTAFEVPSLLMHPWCRPSPADAHEVRHEGLH